ncbi:hypothetical protein E2C01_014580 [Portunus trituberculatus]|uniref:Uncharacterized protein n=1 Tax=Portunus trituberculatus TaxID=210409 RepID=A0A5B7DJ87_PORTR|nr:hypothetical protein [Portunus trituberculatus]
MPRRTLAETDHDLCEVSEKQGEQEGDLLIAQSFHQRTKEPPVPFSSSTPPLVSLSLFRSSSCSSDAQKQRRQIC